MVFVAKWFVIWFTIRALNGIQHEERRSKKEGGENRLFIADQVRELQEYIASVLMKCVYMNGYGICMVTVSVGREYQWIDNLARPFNSFTPGCAGVSHAPWLASVR